MDFIWEHYLELTLFIANISAPWFVFDTILLSVMSGYHHIYFRMYKYIIYACGHDIVYICTYMLLEKTMILYIQELLITCK